MRPSEEFHTQKENIVCVRLHEVSRTEKSIEIMINQGKMRNRKFLLGIRLSLRCWNILKTNYSHGYAIVETYQTTWIIHWRIVKWKMLLCSFYWHEVERKETKVVSHPGSSVDMDEFSTVVGGSHHLVTLISPEHNTGETVCLQVWIQAHMYAQICTDRSPRKTEKNKKRPSRGICLCDRAKSRGMNLNDLRYCQSPFTPISCLWNFQLSSDLCHLLTPPPFLILVLSLRAISQCVFRTQCLLLPFIKCLMNCKIPYLYSL